MKPLFTFLLIPLFSLFQQDGNSETINKKASPRFPMISGTVHYVIKGDASGSARLVFDRNGWRSAENRSLVIKRYGIESKENRLELVNGDNLYQVNLDKSSGKATTDNKWSSLLRNKDIDTSVSIMMEYKNGELNRMDTLLGKPCQVWTFTKGNISEIWLWQGLALRTIKKMPGFSYEQVAEKIEENVPEENTFILAEDITWQ